MIQPKLKECVLDPTLCSFGHNPDGLVQKFLVRHRHNKARIRDYGKKTHSEI